MKMRRWLAATAIVPVAALAMAAAPEGGTDCRGLESDPATEVCRTRTYLQCTAETGKVHHYLIDGMAQFTLDEPAASFQDGAGCGEYDDPLFRTTVQDGAFSFDFAGFVEGNLDAMTVEMHNFGFTPDDRSGEVILRVRVTVDGESPFGSEEVEGATGTTFQSPLTVEIPVEPVVSSTGLTVAYRFTIAGLGAVMDTLEEGLSDQERQVIVTIDGASLASAPTSAGFKGWVWGASEIPSGVIFNPVADDELGTVVEATG